MSYQATMAKEKDYIFDFVGKTCKIMTVINHLVYKGQIFWVIFALVADVSQMIPNAERIWIETQDVFVWISSLMK